MRGPQLNRRGTIEVQWKFIAMLLFNAIILLIIIGFTIKLISLLGDDDTATRAYRNYDILLDRIDVVLKEYRQEDGYLSVVIDIPPPYVIGVLPAPGKSSGTGLSDTSSPEEWFTFSVKASKQCKDNYCVCLGQELPEENVFSVIKCEEYDVDSLYYSVWKTWTEDRGWFSFDTENEGFKPKVLIPSGPRTIQIKHNYFEDKDVSKIVLTHPNIMNCNSYGYDDERYRLCHGKTMKSGMYYGTKYDAEKQVLECYSCEQTDLDEETCKLVKNLDVSKCGITAEGSEETSSEVTSGR